MNPAGSRVSDTIHRDFVPDSDSHALLLTLRHSFSRLKHDRLAGNVL